MSDTPTITRKGLADEIDTYDEAIADLNASKRDRYAAYREQLEREGMAKDNIKTEIAAVKSAIKLRRAIVADELAVEERDARVDEVLEEIHARTRTTHQRWAA